MEDRVKPSLGVRIFAPLFFILGSLAALLWFFYRLFELFFGHFSEVEVFDKGSFYMLGVGAGMFILAFATVQEGWFDKPLSGQQASYLTKAALISIVLLFLLPHVIHYFADYNLTSNGYTVCQDASHQWLFIRDIVYIKDSIECSVDLKTQ